MDLQSYVDGMGAMTCVVSVEDLGDGKYGKIRIVAGNEAYIDSIEKPAPGAELLVQKFEPNTEYTRYLTRDLNFEDACYRAAVGKKCLHSYARPDRMQGIWFNMFFLPVNYEEGNLRYCTYTMEINFSADSENLSSTAGETAAKVLETCIKLRSAKDFKETMNDVIDDIREICSAQSCVILLTDSYERKCSVLCQSILPDSGLRQMDEVLSDGFYDMTETWDDLIAGSNCIIVKNEEDFKVVKERNPAWYESITSENVKSIVLFPLKFRGDLLGYIWACNFAPDDAPKIKQTLETTTFIIGSEISNYLLVDRLKVLSSKDMLTGVMNRNEMNNYVDKLSDEEESDNSVGVVFADLNGLKRMNDDYGHNAGDKLLKDAARALEEVFKTEEIFRAGGDEFSIIIIGITEEELIRKVEELREVSKKYDSVNFALGECYYADKRNVRLALKKADERMYEDKRIFYEKHPELKRHS
jgi:diguanylate cyclase (GGDEF)-like protein